MKRFAANTIAASEPYALTTIRVVAENIDGDEEIWTLTAAEAESRARKYRMVAAHALRGAALCDDHADSVANEPITLPSLTLPIP